MPLVLAGGIADVGVWDGTGAVAGGGWEAAAEATAKAMAISNKTRRLDRPGIPWTSSEQRANSGRRMMAKNER